jgi:hypothetical protein
VEERGWTLGGNMDNEYRWAAGDANFYRNQSFLI